MSFKNPCLLATVFSLLAFAASANADGVTITATSPASTGTGGATVISSGTLTLTGSGSTTTGGTVVVSNPVTTTSTGGTTVGSTGTLTLTGTGSTTTGGTVVVSNPGTITSTGGTTVGSTGTLTLTGTGSTTTGGTVIVSNPVTITSTGGTTLGSSGTLTLTGPVTTTTGGGVLVFNPGTSTSTGSTTLGSSGTLTLTGPVTTTAGGLVLGTTTVFPTSTGTTTVLSTGTLTVAGTGNLTLNPTGANPLLLTSDASVFTSLSTSGHNFSVGMITPPPPAPGAPMPMFIAMGPLAFNASFVLANHTTTDMHFTVPRPNVPMGAMPIYVPNVVFRIYDHAENLIWESWTNPGSMKPTAEVLPAGSSWTQPVLVPLLVNGQWLSGKYVLVATVNGTPEFSATASFEVTSNFNSTTATATGIKGLVVEGPISPVSTPGSPNEKPLAAVIDIAGQWTGPVPSTAMIAVPVLHVKSDSKGHFNATVPPGTYTITGESPNPSAPYPHSTSQTVTVVAGHVTEVIVKYDTGIQ